MRITKVKQLLLVTILFSFFISSYTSYAAGPPLAWELGGNDALNPNPVDATNNILGTIPNLPIRFHTNNTERMRITSTGMVGIGLDIPLTKFHVLGDGISSAIFMNGGVGIGTTTPDPNSNLHIEPVGQFLVHKKGIFVNLPVLDHKGAFSAFYADGSTDYSTVKGIFKGRIGHAKAYSSDGDMIGGVYGYVKPSHITSNLVGYNALATGAACFADLDNITIGNPGTAETWVGGVYAEIKGTISNYPNIGHGAIASVMGVDRIKGTRTYAGYFDGNVDVIGNLKVSDSLFANSINIENKITVDTLQVNNFLKVGVDNSLYFASNAFGINTFPQQQLHIFAQQQILPSPNGGPIIINPYTALRIQHREDVLPGPEDQLWDIQVNKNIGFNIYNPRSALDVLTCRASGKVGLGTTDPTSHLHIEGENPTIRLNDITKLPGEAFVNFYIAAANGVGRLISDKSVTIFIDSDNNSTDEFFRISKDQGGFDGQIGLFAVKEDGNVGIGTDNPQFKLDVCGTIRSHEWIVETFGCDFVFDDNYELPTFKERLDFIRNNKHLMYVQSAKEMQEYGAEMKNTTMGILRNVEEHELYLYKHDEKMKEQGKKIKMLEKENESLRIELKELMLRLEKIETKL